MVTIEIEGIQNVEKQNTIVLIFAISIEKHTYKFTQLVTGQIKGTNASSIIQEAYLRLAMDLEMIAEAAKQKASEQ